MACDIHQQQAPHIGLLESTGERDRKPAVDDEGAQHLCGVIAAVPFRPFQASPDQVGNSGSVCAARTGIGDGVLVGLPALEIRGLSDGDARPLLLGHVHGPIDAAVTDQIIAESRGNPLALLELPRTWETPGLAGGFGGGFGGRG